MKKSPYLISSSLLIYGALFFVIVILVVADFRLRADGAHRREVARQAVMNSTQQVNQALEKIRSASSSNRASSASARTLLNDYINARQTSAGIRNFKVAFLKLEPQILGSLVQPRRNSMSAELGVLSWTLDSHADALRAKEDTDKNTAGGLIATIQRTLSPLQDE